VVRARCERIQSDDVARRSAKAHIQLDFAHQCSHAAAIVAKQDDSTCRFAGLSERMMGLEPTTFCMAKDRRAVALDRGRAPNRLE
jgi:hypothetical protein